MPALAEIMEVNDLCKTISKNIRDHMRKYSLALITRDAHVNLQAACCYSYCEYIVMRATRRFQRVALLGIGILWYMKCDLSEFVGFKGVDRMKGIYGFRPPSMKIPLELPRLYKPNFQQISRKLVPLPEIFRPQLPSFLKYSTCNLHQQ